MAKEMTQTKKSPERRFVAQDSSEIRLDKRDGDELPEIVGLGVVYYDGTPRTEYELWEGVVERIMPGAATSVIDRGDDVRGLFNHSPDNLLGRRSAGTLRLKETKQGMNYYIPPGKTTIARDVVEHIERGDLTGSSFAFNVLGENWRKEDGIEVREITDVEMFDIGPVSFPAYEASTTGVRSEDCADARASYERWVASESEQKKAQIATPSQVALQKRKAALSG